MSWASRRRTSYTTGVILFFAVVIGGPLMFWYLSGPPSRRGGIQKQGETTGEKREAGVRSARYRFGLYDASNVLIAEREGIMYIMPGATTPVIEARIDAGNRIVAHTYFEFTEPFTWERMKNNATAISVSNKDISSVAEALRLSALAQNSSVVPLTDISFVAVVFDPAGNAFTASATSLSRLDAGEASEIVFTWPDPFAMQPSRLDVIPIVAPSLLTAETY